MRALPLLLALVPLIAPTAAAIPPCFENGLGATVSSASLGASVTAQDPVCYTHGIPWTSLYEMGVPSHVTLALP